MSNLNLLPSENSKSCGNPLLLLQKMGISFTPRGTWFMPNSSSSVKDLNLWSSDRDSPWRSLNSGGSQSLENGKKGVDPI